MKHGVKESHKFFSGKQNGHGVFVGASLAFLFTAVIAAILLLGTAFILSMLPNGAAYISTIGALLGLCLSFFGGIAAGKLDRRTGALSGLLFGFMYLVASLLLGGIFHSGAPFFKRLLGLLLFLLLSVLGGALGGYRPTSRIRKMRRR